MGVGMVIPFVVLGHRGMLGSVVLRRWEELGATTAPDGYVINCIRPDRIVISERLAESGQLIQPSTDAIDEDSDYAATKRILERIPTAVTIRSGIIDIDHQPSVAYRNWTCNAITPLEWADYAWDHRDEPAVHITGREPYTRHELASLVAAIWDRPAPIPAYADDPLDRTQKPTRYWPPLIDALTEFHEWLRS